tara:strand:+ start:368 stop:607 length:240 start_codon:yes stop_codon:yes gene_type:complete
VNFYPLVMAQKMRKKAKILAKKMSKKFQKVDEKFSKKIKKNSSESKHKGTENLVKKNRSFSVISCFFEKSKKSRFFSTF